MYEEEKLKTVAQAQAQAPVPVTAQVPVPVATPAPISTQPKGYASASAVGSSARAAAAVVPPVSRSPSQVVVPVPPPVVSAPAAPVGPAAVPVANGNTEPEQEPELTEDEREYIDNLVSSIHHLYDNFPLESNLHDRCEAYGKIIEAPQEQLTEQTVLNVLEQTKQSPSIDDETVYKPESSTRQNFLFTLSAFEGDEVGDEAWRDLVDCVSQWEDGDPQVREFLDSPEQAEVFNRLMELASEEAKSFTAPQPAQAAKPAPATAPVPK